MDPAEHQVTELAGALWASGDPVQMDLARRLSHCQQGRADRRAGHVQRWPVLCRSPACEYCRRWLVARAARRAATPFAPASADHCYHATIHLARAGNLDAVRSLVRTLRTKLRNLRDWHAATDHRWANVAMAGMVEVEALGLDDVALLPRQRRAVVEALPAFGSHDHSTYGYAVVWLAHVHLAIRAPGLDRADLCAAMCRRWPGPDGRVDVRPFRLGSAAEHAAGIVSYAAKHKMRVKLDRDFDCIEVPWPLPVQARYWGWLHGMRSGLKVLRVQINQVTDRERGRSRVDRLLHPTASVI